MRLRRFMRFHWFMKLCQSTVLFIFRVVIHIIPCQLCKCLFAFPFHNSIYGWLFPQNLFCIVGNFRAAKPDGYLRQHLFYVGRQGADHFNIPDITGKPDHVGSSSVDVLQADFHLMVDGVFRQLDHRIRRTSGSRGRVSLQLLIRICLETVYAQIGMDILGVHSHQ